MHVSVVGVGRFSVEGPGGAMHQIALRGRDADSHRLAIDGLHTQATAVFAAGRLHLALAGRACSIDDLSYAPPKRADDAGESSVLAPMNGRLLALLVSPGDQVVKGQRVAVLEAMKLEHQLLARRDGIVERVGAAVGEQLATRALVVKLAEAAA